MSADGVELRALVAALRRIGPRAGRLLADSPSTRAREAAVWGRRARARAALLDAVLATARHRLGGDSPERACADAWVRRACDDVHREYRDAAGDGWSGAMDALLARCVPEAEALARARLDAHASSPARAAVLARLARLGRALGEDAGAWQVPLLRLAPLAALPRPVWPALARAPAWAVVRALADTAITDDAYRRAVVTLAYRPGAWAVDPVRRAAQHVRFDAVEGADPERLGALLAQWPAPWDAVDPPLAMVSAWAETGRGSVGEDTWAAGVHYGARASDAFVATWPDAEAHAGAVERLAPRLRAALDRRFEARAVAHIAHWLSARAWTDAERAAALAEAHVVLARMRALWVLEPSLAPRTGAEHAIRLVPGEPETLFPDDPEDTHARVRPARMLLWRVPCTSPERAVVAGHGLAGLGSDLAARLAFDVAVARPDAPMAHTYPADPPTPERERRERAVAAILARIAAELRR